MVHEGMAAKKHSPGFVKIVDDARKSIKECTVHDVKKRMDAGDALHIVDVREESEFAADHVVGAEHIGKGVIERDIEEKHPNNDQELILYCGGGFRSALAAANLVKMGYTRVISMDGGVRAWREAGYPFEK